MSTKPADTLNDAWEYQRQVLSHLSPEARLLAALDLSESVRRIQIDGLLARNPGWSRADAVRHIIEKQLGIELPGSP